MAVANKLAGLSISTPVLVVLAVSGRMTVAGVKSRLCCLPRHYDRFAVNQHMELLRLVSTCWDCCAKQLLNDGRLIHILWLRKS
jgi:hypothetical protein